MVAGESKSDYNDNEAYKEMIIDLGLLVQIEVRRNENINGEELSA